MQRPRLFSPSGLIALLIKSSYYLTAQIETITSQQKVELSLRNFKDLCPCLVNGELQLAMISRIRIEASSAYTHLYDLR